MKILVCFLSMIVSLSSLFYPPSHSRSENINHSLILSGLTSTRAQWPPKLRRETREAKYTSLADTRLLRRSVNQYAVSGSETNKCGLGMAPGQPDTNGKLGPKGDKGDRGDKGHMGYPGFKGEPGIQGLSGQKGEKGDTSEKGQKGELGNRGFVGPVGPQGSPGKQGVPGIIGQKGERGLSGERGWPGIPGPKGDQGLPGLVGRIGLHGLPGLPGKKGDAGLPGADGLPGERGHRGIPGFPGIPGLFGRTGSPGLKGDRGSPGATGTTGESGLPGLSASNVLVRHSQSSEIPECESDHIKLWEGYSLLSAASGDTIQSQDLGLAGSCIRTFSTMPFIACDVNSVCTYASRNDKSYWLTTSAKKPTIPVVKNDVQQYISRCVVCQTPSKIIAVHSQSLQLPECPKGWSGLWIGYSFFMHSAAYHVGGGQDLSSPGSCLEEFQAMPIIECDGSQGSCFHPTKMLSYWLAAVEVEQQFQKPKLLVIQEANIRDQISKCQVCIEN